MCLYYSQALEQASNIHWPQHCVDVQATAIGWQVGKAKAHWQEVVGEKLVEKVCYFLWKVTPLPCAFMSGGLGGAVDASEGCLLVLMLSFL